ncbi:hypothetical protein Btru_017933 [Bulinus truncatus]|nr:hypothetical protein Btru_017933 [Bulinus truncatus]
MAVLSNRSQLYVIVLVLLSWSKSIVLGSPPNIIFILADDLGWDDVGFHGAEFPTPNIDRLALEGVILNNYYVQPMCTPTRGAILTGKYPIHTGLQHYVIAGSEPYGLPLTEVTLAQHLQTLGYSTKAVGKWHLGFFKKEYLPENRGFDSHYGYYLGRGDLFDHYAQDGGFMGLDLHDNGRPVWNESQVYSTDLFTRKAVDIIRSHNNTKPLFLYLAYQAVHAGNDDDPIQAPQKYIRRFPYVKDVKRRMFAGVASALDDAVGEVYKALQGSGLAENSIIIFSTDNGGPSNGFDGNAACNWPLRGTKNTLWQGGVRGVAFVHSPLLKRKSYINNSLMHAVDWLPTILSLTNTNQTFSKDIDGINQWETISKNVETLRKEVLLNIDPIMKHESLIVGNYKIILGNISGGENDGWYPPPKEDVRLQTHSHSTLVESTNRDASDSQVKIQKMSPTEAYKLIEIMDFHYKNIKNKHSLKNKLEEVLVFIKEMNVSQEFSGDLNIEEALTSRKAENLSGSRSSTVTIDCGIQPFNASTNCQPLKAPCLFNIQDDPCEYYNLADRLPQVVDMLTLRLNVYRSTMVPPANKPIDPTGDPSLHGGVWGPWL